MHVWVRTCMWARLLGEGVTCAWKRLQRRHLAGSLPSSGFGFILPSPAGLGRPNCTDGHLAGTLGHGPVLTCKLLTPPFSASMTLLILQRTDWARTERHWRWKWAGDSSTGLAHGRAPHLTLDQNLFQEDPYLCSSASEAGEAGCRENYAASTGKILLMWHSPWPPYILFPKASQKDCSSVPLLFIHSFILSLTHSFTS